MKNVVILFIILLSTFFAHGQKQINYQGVARGIDGLPVTDQSIGIQFKILSGSTTGPAVYTETQSSKTNSLGLILTQIGLNSDLTTVNWQNGPYYLNVSIDFTGGTNYTDVGTQQIMTVPYALHSQNVTSNYDALNNRLTIGSNSFTLSSTPETTVSGQGVANVTRNSKNNFVVSVPATSISVTSTAGVASAVSNGSNSININIPAAPPSTITNSGAATVTSAGTNTFNVHVPPAGIVMTSTPGNLTASSAGTNSYIINVPSNTVFGTGLAIGASSGNIHTINVPLLTYNQSNGSISSGTNVTNITQTLGLNGSILNSGPSSNAVNLSFISPWRQSVGTVTLANLSDKVGIGSATPLEHLQVESSGSTSVSILGGTSNQSDLLFGTSGNHSAGRIRYDHSLSELSLWSNNVNAASINSAGQMIIGSNSPFSANSGLTISRSGNFNNQLMITGGDNSNTYGGTLSFAENLNYVAGMSLKLDAGANMLFFTNDLNGNSPVMSLGGYSGANPGLAIGSSFAGANPPNDGLVVQGNTGIGTTNPGTKLEVNGDISVPNGNRVVFGTLSGSGSSEWIQNSGSGLQFNTGSQSRVTIDGNGNVGIGTNAPNANLQINGTIRMGSETTTPNYPANGGMIIRRVFNNNVTAGTTVAATPDVVLERDGTNGGFRVTRLGTSALQVCNCTGVNNLGAVVAKSLNNLAAGVTQLYANTENIVFIHCIFGDPFFNSTQHTTEITITRQYPDYFWVGTMNSTFNQ